MKRIFLLVSAAMLLFSTAHAQEAKFDEAAILKKIQKLELDSQNPKKAEKPETWMDLANAYYEAATVASTGLYRGLTELEAQILFPKPEIGSENVAGTDYVKWSYPYFDLYLKDGAVFFWTMKKDMVEGSLNKATAAYLKAYQLDNKNMKEKVSAALEKVANSYKQDADNFYVMQKFNETADAFAAAYEMQNQEPLNKADTLCSFYAGLLYTTGGQYEKGVKYLTASIEHGGESNGEAYYYLYHSYRGLKDYENAKTALLNGLSKFPKNSQILEELIVLYGELNEDPKEIIPKIEEGVKNDPKNPDLWAGLGRVQDQLGNTEAALQAFAKAQELAPDDFNANFNYALMFLRQTDQKTEEFNQKTFTSREERDAAIKELDKLYEQAIGPLEKAHAANPDEATTIELLKNVYFRLRDSSPEMMKNFEKYDALFKKLNNEQ